MALPTRRPAPTLVVLAVLLVTALPAAAQRLPDLAVPEHYTLWFAPDFTRDNFRGTASIKLRLKRPSTTITMNAAEIEFGTVTVTSGKRKQTATVALDPKNEFATLTVPTAIPAGAATVDIEFVGILNDKLRGFYLSKANGRKYAVTQLEATDARRAFPGFDEPIYKATFDISLTIDAGDMAISNGEQIADTPGPGAGKHTLKFARTPKMSSYLVAMLVGDFACRSGAVGDIPLRVCSTPDKKELTGFALEAAQFELKWFNDYFGIKYPFGKLDIIGIPDFAAGAMENVGAITFRERTLLADPRRASIGVKKNIAGVISHEIAHQWFGDLVTMKWWDDIWLNEGFATWLANKPLEEWKPEWNVQLDDVADTWQALSTDSLRNTRAIRIHVETPDEINEVFDSIAYEKTAAVLRMIEHYVGKEPFRRAVSSYLRKFAFSNAAGEDFWNEVARVTGKPLDRIMASFVTQPGAPVLAIESRCAGNATELPLKQSRFAGSATSAAVPQNQTPSAQTWTLPVCPKPVGGGAPACRVMAKPAETITVPGCGAPVFANSGSVGYYFSEYTPEAVRALVARASTLTPAERLGLLGDEWAMTRATKHDIGTYLDLAGALAADEADSITGEVATRLGYSGAYLVKPADQPAYQAWVRAKFLPVLQALGIPGPLNDSEERQSRRASLLGLLGGTANVAEVQKQARDLAMQYLQNPASVPGTLAPTVLRIGAAGGDAALYERYLAKMKETAADPEEYFRFFNALPAFSDPKLVDRTLELSLSDEVRSQDTPALVGGLMGSAASRERAWTFVKTNWSRVTTKLDVFQGLPGIVGSLGSFCSTRDAEDVRQFFAKHPLPPIERTLRQAIERIESCAALADRQAPAVSKWLQSASR